MPVTASEISGKKVPHQTTNAIATRITFCSRNTASRDSSESSWCSLLRSARRHATRRDRAEHHRADQDQERAGHDLELVLVHPSIAVGVVESRKPAIESIVLTPAAIRRIAQDGRVAGPHIAAGQQTTAATGAAKMYATAIDRIARRQGERAGGLKEPDVSGGAMVDEADVGDSDLPYCIGRRPAQDPGGGEIAIELGRVPGIGEPPGAL